MSPADWVIACAMSDQQSYISRWHRRRTTWARPAWTKWVRDSGFCCWYLDRSCSPRARTPQLITIRSTLGTCCSPWTEREPSTSPSSKLKTTASSAVIISGTAVSDFAAKSDTKIQICYSAVQFDFYLVSPLTFVACLARKENLYACKSKTNTPVFV